MSTWTYRSLAWAVGLVIAWLFVDCQTSQAAPITVVPPGFISETVVSGLFQPTAMAWTGDGRLLINEKGGVVRVMQDNVLLPTPFIDLSAEVNYQVERGLLGLAVHPDFPITPYVYLYFAYDPPGVTADGEGARVARLIRVTADPTNLNSALPGSSVVLLGANSMRTNIGNENTYTDLAQPSCEQNGQAVADCIPVDGQTHMGGGLKFGADGSLYVAIGDGSDFRFVDTRSIRAQQLDSLAGKVLRIDPLTGQGYPDNPYYDGDVTHTRSKVWSYGLRNPFRLTIDPATQEVIVGKLASGDWEEIHRGQGNFGWPCYRSAPTGMRPNPTFQNHPSTAATCQALYTQGESAIQPPLYGYQVDGRDGAVIVGDIYQGNSYPAAYQGAFFFGDYLTDWIKYLTFDSNGAPTMHDFATEVTAVTGLVQLAVGPDTNLYYLAFNWNNKGTVQRIRYVAGNNTAPTAALTANPTSGLAPLTVTFTGAGSTDPDGESLTYQWDFGDGTSANTPNATHTYSTTGSYTATLMVSDSFRFTSTASVRIVAGNSAPRATIAPLANNGRYRIGDLITFSGQASDAQEGVITPDQLTWQVILHAGLQTDETYYTGTGASGSFTVTDQGDSTWLEICLTARDSAGLTDRSCTALTPQTTAYTFTSNPPGLLLFFDGAPFTTPFTVYPIVNAHREIRAPLQQPSHSFVAWSNTGAATQELTIGEQPQTLTATYNWQLWLPALARSGQ